MTQSVPAGEPFPGGPLAGVRVLEIASMGPGPFCAMLLAGMGADVLRVERPADATTAPRPKLAGGRPKVVIDLKDPAGHELAMDLVGAADILIEGFRPGVLERLGLGPDVCHERNPRLVFGRMTGWGQDGPLAQAAGHDINYIALTGALSAIGRAGGPPQVPLNLLGDFGGGGMLLAAGVLAALLRARETGLGQVVDGAIVDGVTLLSAMVYEDRGLGRWQDERGTNRLDSGAPFYDIYQTRDESYVAVGALEQRFYDQLLRVLELEDLPTREVRSNWQAIRTAIAARFLERPREEWTRMFSGTDACVTPVLSWAEAAADPHIRARGTILDDDGVLRPGPAPRFSDASAATDRGAAAGRDRSPLASWPVGDAAALASAVARAHREHAG